MHKGEKTNFLNNNSDFQSEIRVLSYIYESILYMTIAHRFSPKIEKARWYL